ncbi:hypothetical protein PQR33_40565 [Paraburkholderia sediminicola]|uniref:hypothetical protein n=1 Tax=Paraburkholderia sediminicola TaxID=458836 RepID=UPI0038BD783F
MKILFVEDDEFKFQQVNDFLVHKFSPVQIFRGKSVTSGIRLLDEGSYDLVLLDMSLPTYDTGRQKPQAFGGRNLLRYIDGLDSQPPAIVVTQLETFGEGESLIDIHTLRGQLLEEHGEYLKGLVYYNSRSEAWQQELTSIIEQSGH